MLPFALWASVPFVGMAIAARAFHDSSRSMAVLWLGALAIVVGSVALYFQTFVFDLDAQGGIVFAMLPFLQMLAFLPFLGLAVLLRSHRMAPGNRHQS